MSRPANLLTQSYLLGFTKFVNFFIMDIVVIVIKPCCRQHPQAVGNPFSIPDPGNDKMYVKISVGRAVPVLAATSFSLFFLLTLATEFSSTKLSRRPHLQSTSCSLVDFNLDRRCPQRVMHSCRRFSKRRLFPRANLKTRWQRFQ